jgi:hypothetical protein
MSWFDDNLGNDLARQLIRINVNIDGQIIDRDVRPDVDINYDMLEEELQNISASFSFWAILLAECKKIVAIIERKVKRRRGEVTNLLLNEAKKEGVRLRGTDVKDLIETDDLIEKLEAQLILANRSLSKIFAVVDAMRMKSEMLRSLAGFKKQEMRDSDQST